MTFRKKFLFWKPFQTYRLCGQHAEELWTLKQVVYIVTTGHTTQMIELGLHWLCEETKHVLTHWTSETNGPRVSATLAEVYQTWPWELKYLNCGFIVPYGSQHVKELRPMPQSPHWFALCSRHWPTCFGSVTLCQGQLILLLFYVCCYRIATHWSPKPKREGERERELGRIAEE
jgi:hypothetical protein